MPRHNRKRHTQPRLPDSNANEGYLSLPPEPEPIPPAPPAGSPAPVLEPVALFKVWRRLALYDPGTHDTVMRVRAAISSVGKDMGIKVALREPESLHIQLLRAAAVHAAFSRARVPNVTFASLRQAAAQALPPSAHSDAHVHFGVPLVTEVERPNKNVRSVFKVRVISDPIRAESHALYYGLNRHARVNLHPPSNFDFVLATSPEIIPPDEGHTFEQKIGSILTQQELVFAPVPPNFQRTILHRRAEP